MCLRTAAVCPGGAGFPGLTLYLCLSRPCRGFAQAFVPQLLLPSPASGGHSPVLSTLVFQPSLPVSCFQVPLPMDFSNKNTGADCHYPLQGMCLLLTQYYTVLIPVSAVIMIMFLVYNMMCILSYVQPFCNLMDNSQAGSSVPGIFQARILDWVAISFSRRSF